MAFFVWTLLTNAHDVTGGATFKELTPETFEELSAGLQHPQRLFIDFTQGGMYRKMLQKAAEMDSSNEVTYATLNCGPHHTWCHEKQLRPWNSLQLFHASTSGADFTEFPLAVLGGIQEDDKWKKALEFAQMDTEEKTENLVETWEAEWKKTRPPFSKVGIEEIRDDNFNAAFDWLLAHESRQLFMLYTGVQKPCESQLEHLQAALQDVSPDVSVRMGVVNCDAEHQPCKAASVASYCFVNHFTSGPTGNACPVNTGGPRGSAHFRGALNKETLTEAMLKKFEGKPADKDYKRKVALMIDGGSTKPTHDEF